MALTAAQTAQLYQIMGVPQGGTARTVMRIATLYGPSGEVFDFAAVVTMLTTQLTEVATNSSREARVTTLLTAWEDITSYSNLRVDGAGTNRGRLVHHERARETIRQELANLIGFYVPRGGFQREMRDACDEGGCRVVRA